MHNIYYATKHSIYQLTGHILKRVCYNSVLNNIRACHNAILCHVY